jgi:ubiquinone/menaquinone biosynthesis C-methylase UbiE/uncharacterized protein YbaR (Trm112 family)
MSYFSDLKKIKQKYNEGVNLIEYLKDKEGDRKSKTETIMVSYDIQSGSYTQGDIKRPEVRDNYTTALAKVINKLSSYNSIVEAGVGEATTLAKVLPKLHQRDYRAYGFDISWSRIKYAKENCLKKSLDQTTLFTGDLFNIPLLDNSVDLVYTLHSLEPNGGREKEALAELYRITGKYLILLEPAYEWADEEGKARMDKLGYVKNLIGVSKELGYKVIEYRPFDYSVNPLNPTGIIMIEKEKVSDKVEFPLACPISKKPLSKFEDCFYCEQSLLAYPIIADIPCLLPQNAIVATHFLDKI